MDFDGNNENKKDERTISKFDYSIAFAFIALLLMVGFCVNHRY